MALAAARKRRLRWPDYLLLALIGLAVAYIVYRVNTVLNYKWNWAVIPQYILRWDEDSESWVPSLLLQGFLTTLRLMLWGSVLALALGVIMGLIRTGRTLLFKLIGRTYVELIRNIPPVVFIFIFYFFFSEQITPLLGIDEYIKTASPDTLAVIEVLFGDPKRLKDFVSGLICLALLESAYVAEIVRAGVQSIDKGQWEASASIGLSRYSTLRYVILPQALQRVVPPLANQMISLVKDSAIISLISIQELTYKTTEVVINTRAIFEAWLTTAAMYFALCYVFALLFGRLEKRMKIGQR